MLHADKIDIASYTGMHDRFFTWNAKFLKIRDEFTHWLRATERDAEFRAAVEYGDLTIKTLSEILYEIVAVELYIENILQAPVGKFTVFNPANLPTTDELRLLPFESAPQMLAVGAGLGALLKASHSRAYVPGFCPSSTGNIVHGLLSNLELAKTPAGTT